MHHRPLWIRVTSSERVDLAVLASCPDAPYRPPPLQPTTYSHHVTLFTISGLPLKRSESYIFQSYNCFKSSITLINNYKTNVTTKKTVPIKHKTFSYVNYYIVQNNFVLVLIVNIVTIARNSPLIVESYQEKPARH